MKQFSVTVSHHSEPDLQKALEVIGQRLGEGLIPGPIKYWETATGAGFSCRCNLIMSDDHTLLSTPGHSSKK